MLLPHKFQQGGIHSLAIKDDGTLWAWGNNRYKQLGIHTLGYKRNAINRSCPTQVGRSNQWSSVSAGSLYSLGIKKDGTLWAWGNNSSYELGDGTTRTRIRPVQIGDANNWDSVYAGEEHSVGIKTDGTLWAWGYNDQGQLGDGTTLSIQNPERIGSDYWSTASINNAQTFAIKIDGTLWAWGFNGSFQINGSSRAKFLNPVQIKGIWSSVSAGDSHTFAIKSNGTLWAWGSNWNGRLGDGTTRIRKSPVQIEGNWSKVIASSGRTIGLKNDGTLWQWGKNGDNNINLIPTLLEGNSHWNSVFSGNLHSIAVNNDGRLWAWGYNEYGILGNNTASRTYTASLTKITCRDIKTNPVPTVIYNKRLVVNSGSHVIINSSKLTFVDEVLPASQIVYTIVRSPKNGVIRRGRWGVGFNNTFTQADINRGDISYTHNGYFSVNDTFGFRVSDGSGAQSVAYNFSIGIRPQADNGNLFPWENEKIEIKPVDTTLKTQIPKIIKRIERR